MAPMQLVVYIYMPTEYNSFRDTKKTGKFNRILEVLSLDITELGNTPFELMGDFNVHIGSSPIEGVTSNHPKVGKHGRILQEWLQLNDLTIVNSHPNLTTGLWTCQQGTSKSILDLVIKRKK